MPKIIEKAWALAPLKGMKKKEPHVTDRDELAIYPSRREARAHCEQGERVIPITLSYLL